MMLQYDPEADALFARIRVITPEEVGGGDQIDGRRIVHYDRAGEVVGLEFLDASMGIDLNGLPCADELREALHSLGRLTPAA